MRGRGPKNGRTEDRSAKDLSDDAGLAPSGEELADGNGEEEKKAGREQKPQEV